MLVFYDLCCSHLQYKVLRGGCWEKVNFENQKPQTNKKNRPRVLLAHPWIQHFRSACREQNVLACDLQERTSFGNLEVRGIGEMAFAPADLATNMKQFSLCRSDSVGSNTGSSQLSFAVFSTEIYLSLACIAYFRSCGFVLSINLSGMLFVRDSDIGLMQDFNIAHVGIRNSVIASVVVRPYNGQ